MIGRMWRGLALPEKADDYEKHLQTSVLPELRQIDGFEEVYLLRQNSAEGVEFIVLLSGNRWKPFINSRERTQKLQW